MLLLSPLFPPLEFIGVYSDEKVSAATGKPWEPDDLNSMTSMPLKKKISKTAILSSIVMTVIAAALYFAAAGYTAILDEAVCNESMLQSFFPFVIGLLILKGGLIGYQWLKGWWSQSIAVINGVYHLIYMTFLIIISSQANLFNTAYLADLSERFNLPMDYMEIFPYLILWVIVVTIITYLIYDIIAGFRKAKKSDLHS